MAMRLSGLMSGMDTDSIVQELVAVKQMKVDELVKKQTKLEWKQEAWKELNSKIKKLYNGTLSSLRFQSAYSKKVTKVSDSSVADVIAGDTAMDSVQSLRVERLAQTGYLTGAEVKKTDGSKCTAGTKLSDMGIEVGSQIEITCQGKTTSITVEEGMTLGQMTDKLAAAGVNANFDSKTQRIFIGAKESGKAADFTITAGNDKGTDALQKLGILVYDDSTMAKYQSYVDLKSDDDAYKTALDADVASRLKDILANEEMITKSLEKLKEKQDKAKADYAEKYGVKGDDDTVTDDFDTLLKNAAEIRTVIDRRKELQAKSAEKMTLAEAAELEELNQKYQAYENQYGTDLEAKLEVVEEYQKNEESITKTQEELEKVQSYIITDSDGNKVASPTLNDEVKAALDTKIAKAEAIVSAGSAPVGNAIKLKGCDAEIYLNDAKFTSTNNTFEINGLTITCNAETGGKEVTLTTQQDTSGIYDMIKGFIKEYSELILEMDKLYNADAAKGYEPLTEDEKYAMSEKEVEKWEEKIKESILRKDSTLNNVASAFKQIMSSGFSVNGQTMYLADFGIETLGYFEAADNERNVYHIYGDEDDEFKSSEPNKLKAMISSDPNAVIDFFSQLTKSLYSKTTDLMKSVQDYSSSYTVYEDKKMKSEYDDYTKKIAQLEEKLADYESKWYSKFAAMETAMAKMQSNANAVTSMLGGM